MALDRPRSIVVDPQPEGGQQAPADKPEEGTADPLAYVIPQDAEGVDPTYRGKSVADIIEMQTNATRKIGEQANEIGIWRNLVSEYAEGKQGASPVEQGTQPANEEPLEITSDQLLDHPVESIEKVVARSVEAALAPITQQLTLSKQESERDQFLRDYPEAETIGQDDAFREWATGSPERARLAQATTQGDFGSARYLLDAWRDRQSILEAVESQNEERQQQQETQLKPSGTEGARQSIVEAGGAGGAPRGDILNSRDLIHMIQNDPDRYHSEAFQAELQQAAKEGRLVL